MPLKIFVTGATGYIGGDALHAIVNAHPEYEIACLVRSSDKGAQVASQLSKARLVYGDLDSSELLEAEAKEADIVLHCASSDHEGAAKAILEGLAARTPNRPGYLIHTSGTGILTFTDTENQIFGEASTKVYDDWDGIESVTSLPDFAPHRPVDKIVLAGSTKDESNIKTAIVCPPCIYGKGRGAGNQRSIQIYDLTKAILSKKQGIQVGAGKTYWNNVHIRDLSELYLKLVEAATSGAENAFWNNQGYYFAENGEHVWGEISRKVTSEAHKQGFLPSEDVISVTGEEADQLRAHASLLWGANSRSNAIRARKLLGWTPKERSIEDEIPEVVSGEARLLGLVKGHAAKVAG